MIYQGNLKKELRILTVQWEAFLKYIALPTALDKCIHILQTTLSFQKILHKEFLKVLELFSSDTIWRASE